MTPSEEQERLLQTVAAGHHVVGDCVAGAGKTTTVLMLAQRLPTKRILQMTYNSQLKSEVRQKVVEAGLENVEVHTYHSLVVRYYDRKGYDDTVMQTIVQTNKQPIQPLHPCDILVLDEAQDMTPLYFRLIKKFQTDLGTPVQFLILGDRYQGIYKFKDADPRYLTLCPSVWQQPFMPVSLSTSYRVTNEIASFVNQVMLGYNRIKATRSGPSVKYYRCNMFGIHNKMATLVNGMLKGQQSITDFLFGAFAADQRPLDGPHPTRKESLSPEDIFVLAPSLKSDSPLRKLENALVALHIPCYFPTSDDGKLEEDVIKGKVVFSTFHQAKGRERKVVLLYGFDASYFKYYGKDYDPNTCPETLYVAATRAKEELIVLEHAPHGPLPFLQSLPPKTSWLEVMDSAGGKQKEKPSSTSVSTHHSVSVIELTRFLKETATTTLTTIMNTLIEVETPATYSVSIPSKVATGETYEDVAEVNGLVIPAIFEARLCGVSTIETDVRNKYIDIQGKDSFVFFQKAYQALPKQIRTIKDFLYLGVLYVSMTEKLFHKLEQIPTFQWLTRSMITDCLVSLEGELDAETVFEQQLEYICESFPEFGSIRICGRMDAVTDESVWEIKCTETLSLEHKVQLLLYGYLWKQVFEEEYGPRIFRLLNLRTGERLRLDTTSPFVEEAVRIVLENKYMKQTELDDTAFLASCGSLRSKASKYMFEE